MEEKKARVGIMGGTFNPIHEGHIVLAKRAFMELGLDKVLFMPSQTPPHKACHVSAHERADMVKLAIEGMDSFEFSDFELKREGNTYTYETLELLKSENPDTEYYFIIGADSLVNFDKWKKPDRIAKLTTLVAAKRNDIEDALFNIKVDELTKTYGCNIIPINMDEVPVSSTDIRIRVANGEPVEDYVNNKVCEYIREHNLYSDLKFKIQTFADTEILKEDLVKRLNKHRFEHSICVANICSALAMKYEADVFKAYVTGLFHDIAKCIPDEETLEICDRNCIKIRTVERDNPYLLHGKVGAYIAKHEYNMYDEDMMNAIIYHTTGRPDMSLLEKIVFVADYIEPMRDKAPNLAYIRRIAFENIDECVRDILSDTLKYLEKRGGTIDESTRETYEFYNTLCNGGNSHDI